MMKKLLANRKKMNSAGFTLVELLVAMAILGVVSVIIYSFMVSSSRFYERTSSDADIQMEAQLVANTISDLIIDCEVNIRYDTSVSDQIPDAFTEGTGSGEVEEEGGEAEGGEEAPAPASEDGIKADPNDGKTLEIDNSDFQFLIINAEDDKLYYLERKADPATGQYAAFNMNNAELLAENVTDFEVDLSRVKGKAGENIVTFSMTYKKGNRSYSGIYQVNLRNQVTVNEVVTEKTERKTTIDKLVMSPDVFVTIKGKDVPYLVTEADRNLDFSVSYKANNLTTMEDLFAWSVDNGYGYQLPDPVPTGSSATISLPANFDLNTLAGSNFRVTVQSNIKNKAGENLSASAKVYFKKVENVTVTPTMGIVNDEASADSSVMVKAIVDGWHLDNAEKYVDWTLQYYTNQDKEVRECPANIATLGASNTSAYIRLSDNVTEDHHFIVTATSRFDDEWSGTYEFGITPPPPYEGQDSASRGVEIDVMAYALTHPENMHGWPGGTLLGFSNLKVYQASPWDDKTVALFDLVYVPPKAGETYGSYKVYLNYEDFSYQNTENLLTYYEAAEVKISGIIHYLDSQGNETTFNLDLSMNLEPTSIMPDQDNLLGVDAYAEDASIIVPYGGSIHIPFTTTGYNITKKNQIGIYLSEKIGSPSTTVYHNINANEYGYLDLNQYLSGEYVGTIGTRSNYVCEGAVKLVSKSSNPVRPVGAIETRITVDSMYRMANYGGTTISSGASELSELTYKIYVANVEGTNIYMLGPNEDGSWKQKVDSGQTVDCKEYAPCNIDGTISAVTVKGNTVYQLTYAGNTYYYNTTYHYWQKQ